MQSFCRPYLNPKLSCTSGLRLGEWQAAWDNFCRPSGTRFHFRGLPRAYALGYYLPPLRGWVWGSVLPIFPLRVGSRLEAAPFQSCP